MAKRTSVPPVSTPSLKSSASKSGQQTLFGFFQKTPLVKASTALPDRTPTKSSPITRRTSKSATFSSSSELTPAPSSDALEPEEDEQSLKASPELPPKGLPSPVSADEGQTNGTELTASGTPTRRVCFPILQIHVSGTDIPPQAKKKVINYIESDSEGTDDDKVLVSAPKRASRAVKRRRLADSEDEDVYEQEQEVEPDDGKIIHLDPNQVADYTRFRRLHRPR